MRLIIIFLQLIVIMFVYVLAAGFAPAGSAAPFNPRIMVGIVSLPDALLTFVATLVSVILPFVLASFLLLICSLLSYIRFLRWMRWVGFGVCLIAIAYSLFYLQPDQNDGYCSGVLQWIYGVYFSINALLFYAMPRWPHIELTRKGVCLINLLIAGGITALFLCSNGWQITNAFSQHIAFALILLLCTLPYIINFFASRRMTLQGDAQSLKRQVKWLLVIAAVNLVYIVGMYMLFPALAIPPALSFLLLLFLCETQLLYRGNLPQQKNAFYYFKMVLIGHKPEQS